MTAMLWDGEVLAEDPTPRFVWVLDCLVDGQPEHRAYDDLQALRTFRSTLDSPYTVSYVEVNR